MPKERAWSFVVSAVVVLTSACGSPDAPFLDDPSTLDQPIINGQRSVPGHFPTTGALLVRGTSAYGFDIDALCSGTLIAPDVVLTAAHCQYTEPPTTRGARVRYYFSFALDVTAAGQTLSDMPAHTYEAQSFVRHPLYHQTGAHGLGHVNDAALVFLKRPVLGVTPATVLRAREAGIVRVGAPVHMVGYGVRTNPEVDPDAHDAGVKMEASSVINEVGRYEIQVGHGLPAAEKCYGDSGGPTYITTPWGERLLGITSRLYDDFGFHKGTVDSRADVLADWVQQTLAGACRDGRRVNCGGDHRRGGR
jgi:hypothetical protein